MAIHNTQFWTFFYLEQLCKVNFSMHIPRPFFETHMVSTKVSLLLAITDIIEYRIYLNKLVDTLVNLSSKLLGKAFLLQRDWYFSWNKAKDGSSHIGSLCCLNCRFIYEILTDVSIY